MMRSTNKRFDLVARVDLSGGTLGNGVLLQEYVRRGITQWQYRVAYRDTYGRKRSKTFFIGTEYTWSKARERAAFDVARGFRIAYEIWCKYGGTHPTDTKLYHWSAREN